MTYSYSPAYAAIDRARRIEADERAMEQLAAQSKLAAILTNAAKEIEKLDFPVCEPSVHFGGVSEIAGQLRDMAVMQPDDVVAELAWDKVNG